MNQVVDKKQWYPYLYGQLKKRLNGHTKIPFKELRQSGMETFNRIGFPHQKQEEWRFTDISPISQKTFEPVLSPQLTHISKEDLDELIVDKNAPYLVFENGWFRKELSKLDGLPGDVTVHPLSDGHMDDTLQTHIGRYVNMSKDGFTALNTALFSDGAFIHIPKNTAVSAPIQLLYLNTAVVEPTLQTIRNLVIMEENTQATILEMFGSQQVSTYFTNAVSEISLANNAALQHYKIQNESRKAYHIATTKVHQERDSDYLFNGFDFGSRISRNEVQITVNGENAHTGLYGLYLANEAQLIDNHSVIDHARPHCNSDELFKGIIDDKAGAVFSGKIHVRQDAQKINANQSNQNLLLSDDATVDTKPQLEIFADDVKCSHGSTVGQLDKDALFYLRTRGIPERKARHIMIEAFAVEITDKLKNQGIRKVIKDIIESRLKEGQLS